MAAPKNNQNAKKQVTVKSQLQIRCLPAEKASYEETAKSADMTTAKWVRTTLNKAVQEQEQKQ